jgi:hypothetical protein
MNGTLRAFVTTIKGKIRQIIISGVIRHPNGTIITIFMLQTKGQNVSWLAIVSEKSIGPLLGLIVMSH